MRVKLVATIWLCCQMVAFAAAPYVLCTDHDLMAMSEGHKCGPTHHHHEQPVSTESSHAHHHHPTAASSTTTNTATLDCRCTLSDAALAALMLDSGIVLGAFTLEQNAAPVPVVLADYAAPTRSLIPDTPPPRA